MNRRKIMLIVAIVAAAILSVTGIVIGLTSLDPSLSCIGSGQSRAFTLVASGSGFNNSKTVAGLGVWPIMNVSRCDKVTVNISNVDSQDHGIAIGVYSMDAMNIAPGQTFSLSFVAYQTGHFRVYCTTLCLIHDYMANGQLNVA